MTDPQTASMDIDVSVIVTAHREGPIAGATARSALEAIAHAREEAALRVEIIVVLDRADATTDLILRNALPDATVLETDFGDPGLARNHGVANARGTCAAFLDADDLWSYNWLSAAWRAVENRPDAIFHAGCIMAFGRERHLWWHIDSEGGLYDQDYLAWGNYWDALAFARTALLRKFPFRANDLKAGYGHEDWHWNKITIVAGVPHKPVPRTIHFKRRREGSQMSAVAKSDAVIWPVDMNAAGPAVESGR